MSAQLVLRNFVTGQSNRVAPVGAHLAKRPMNSPPNCAVDRYRRGNPRPNAVRRISNDHSIRIARHFRSGAPGDRNSVRLNRSIAANFRRLTSGCGKTNPARRLQSSADRIATMLRRRMKGEVGGLLLRNSSFVPQNRTTRRDSYRPLKRRPRVALVWV